MSDRINYPIGWVQLGDDGKISDFELRLVVRARPVVLKNSKIIAPIGAKCQGCRHYPRKCVPNHTLLSAKSVGPWMKEANKQLRKQWPFGKALPATVELNAAIVTYTKTKARADASNLYQAPEDAMQAAGVITDDYQIRSHDGSGREYDKENPRVEITLTPWRQSA